MSTAPATLERPIVSGPGTDIERGTPPDLGIAPDGGTVPERGMVVGGAHGPGSDLPDDDGTRPTSGTTPPRRRWLVVGLVAALVAAGVVLTAGPDEVEVLVPDPASGAMVIAPPAPAGPIARRWSVPLPTERQLVGLAHVEGDLVWASRRGAFAESDPGLVVVSHATRDGARHWVREFTDPDTAVLVGSTPEDLALLAAPPTDTPPIGDLAFTGRSMVVALAPDGTTAWELPLAGSRTSGLLDTVRGRLVLRDEDGVREVDPQDGSVTARMPNVVDENGTRTARRGPGAWVVPTATGWEVRPDRGPVLTVDGPVAPAVTPDLVVMTDGVAVRALARDDGRPAWEADLGAPVVALAPESVPGTDPDMQGGPFPLPPAAGVGVVTVTTADGDGPTTTLLSATGRVVPTSGDRKPAGGHLNVRIAIDGRDWSLCARSSYMWPPSTCPHDLALADDGGGVVAGVDDVTGVGRASGTWSRVTRVGLILQDGDTVQLRRWPDLALGWSVTDGAVDSIPNPIMVVSSTRGVGIGTHAAVTDSVTWYG